jgi:hypothetical protein
VELYFHSPICLPGRMLNKLSTGTTLPFFVVSSDYNSSLYFHCCTVKPSEDLAWAKMTNFLIIPETGPPRRRRANYRIPLRLITTPSNGTASLQLESSSCCLHSVVSETPFEISNRTMDDVHRIIILTYHSDELCDLMPHNF